MPDPALLDKPGLAGSIPFSQTEPMVDSTTAVLQDRNESSGGASSTSGLPDSGTSELQQMGLKLDSIATVTASHAGLLGARNLHQECLLKKGDWYEGETRKSALDPTLCI